MPAWPSLRAIVTADMLGYQGSEQVKAGSEGDQDPPAPLGTRSAPSRVTLRQCRVRQCGAGSPRSTSAPHHDRKHRKKDDGNSNHCAQAEGLDHAFPRGTKEGPEQDAAARPCQSGRATVGEEDRITHARRAGSEGDKRANVADEAPTNDSETTAGAAHPRAYTP